MAVTRTNKLQRTTDGNYLSNSGTWVASSSDNVRKLQNRADVGAVVQSKQTGIYRKVKSYDITEG